MCVLSTHTPNYADLSILVVLPMACGELTGTGGVQQGAREKGGEKKEGKKKESIL